jgi:glutamine amidotransferase
MTKISIVDYGVGNLHSIRRGIELAGADARVTSDRTEIEAADAIVLPGVGAFDDAMEGLKDKLEPIVDEVRDGKPLLGICLGMQLLLTRSEEGKSMGLNIIPGEVFRLPKGLKVPQMGWNSLEIRREHPIIAGIAPGSYMYFVHSYYARPKDSSTILTTTDYGIEFPSIIAQDSIIGVQFHPEKSSKIGLQMLKNFVSMVKG